MTRPIAIHLPQFHPIPENDQWWGRGFTEWTNVARAMPLFKDHYQPHIPSDLGFYDLRLEETRIAQAELAREYGIHGFCYYHYWFNGKRLLQRPLDDMIRTGTPDFPFMLCWANENWSRRWDGNEQEVLMRQNYSEQDDVEHISFLCDTFFSDRRYIRIDNKPFFAVYRPLLFPDIRRTTDTWRETARRLGYGDLYLAYVQGFNFRKDPAELGFDAAIDFQPDFYTSLPTEKPSIAQKILNKLLQKKSLYTENSIRDYARYVDLVKRLPAPPYKQFPCITPMWDNTARRKTGATIFKGSTPEIYEGWLKHIVRNYTPPSNSENFIFINAWNEWAEGNHLEPCMKWGRAYLEATKRAIGHE
ncbi:MAG TPA: glycoside hydrolase family 99-like domain-containing protein [Puia sp.]|nr:glycoside hydrolase family 99-like domain-containing protein [Puia sp.]